MPERPDPLRIALRAANARVAAACDANDLHGARRANEQARLIVARVYRIPPVTARANGGRER